MRLSQKLNSPNSCHSEFISESDIQRLEILKQVQDDWINNF